MAKLTKTHNPHQEAAQEAYEIKSDELIIIEPRGFNIVWGNDSRYWNIVQQDVAELLQVCWLEVTTSVDCLKPGNKYKVGFTVSLKRGAFGWNGYPVYVMAKVGKKGKYSRSNIKVLDLTEQKVDVPDDLVIDIPNSSSQQDSTLYFGLYEVWSGKWKGGLQIHRAFVKKL